MSEPLLTYFKSYLTITFFGVLFNLKIRRYGMIAYATFPPKTKLRGVSNSHP